MKMRNHYTFLKWEMLNGLPMRRLLFGAFAVGSAILFISIIHMGHKVEHMEPLMNEFGKCPLNLGFNPFDNGAEIVNPSSALWIPLFGGVKLSCQKSRGFFKNIFQQLVDENMLNSTANVLFVGEGLAPAMVAMQEMGFSRAYSIWSGGFVYELDVADAYFDFVFLRAVDKVSMPALVFEIERVLCPGGNGAMLVGPWDLFSGDLVRSVNVLSSFLKNSDVIHLCNAGSFALIIFQKRFQKVISYEHYPLPKNCPAMTNNSPFLKFIEPLVDEKLTGFPHDVSYLPKFMNISSRNKLIHVSIGAEESTDMSVSKLVQPYRSIHSKNFNVFLMDHDVSVLSSHVKNPGIVFIYHPGLSEDSVVPEVESDELTDDEEFDFIRWFKETVGDNDFVVLRINAKRVSYDILGDLFKSGAICYVDELFLYCPDARNCKGATCGDCMRLFKSLRSSGVFVHQWMGD